MGTSFLSVWSKLLLMISRKYILFWCHCAVMRLLQSASFLLYVTVSWVLLLHRRRNNSKSTFLKVKKMIRYMRQTDFQSILAIHLYNVPVKFPQSCFDSCNSPSLLVVLKEFFFSLPSSYLFLEFDRKDTA